MAFFQSISRKFIIPFLSPFTTNNSFSSSTPPSLSQHPLVSPAVTILKHHRSKSRWSNLRSLLAGNNHRLSPSQFSEIVLQLRNNASLSFRFFNFTIRHSLCSHSLFSYATVIHILSRSRLKLQAQKLIKSAICVFSESHQQNSSSPVALFEALTKTYRACDSAPFVFDLLVKACLESKKTDAATEIYKMLRSKNLFLRTGTCNSLIELVSKCRGCFAGYDLYKEIFGFVHNVGGNGSGGKGVVPSANTFNLIMVGFYREGMVEKVKEVWEEMERVGWEANVYGYNVLMAANCDAKRMEDAMRVWKKMENKGLKRDAVSYNTIIGGFCGVGEVGKAEEIYREMVMNSLESTCITFEHLIKGYCKAGDADSAMLLYKDMCRKGFSPENSTVNVIVKTLCDKNEVSAAIQFFRLETKKYGAVLEKENYESLIKALSHAGSLEEALKLQAEMGGKGFQPDSEIYGAFIDGYMKQGNEIMACMLEKEMLRK